ncbi:MAG: hypothetical protein ABI791_13980 [Acidobacteriota bacterium]
MVDIEKFERLCVIDTSSWALWSDTGDSSVQFFRERLRVLHGRAIFVGLNRSSSWSGKTETTHLSNFHAPKHVGDRRLKKHIQDAGLKNLIGGFMTDVSEVIESRSGRVTVDSAESTRVFVDKVAAMDDSREREIICFGDKVFETLRKGLGIKGARVSNRNHSIKSFESRVDGEIWTFHRVWHYSNYGKLLHKSESELPMQLALIDDQITSQTTKASS